MDKIAVCAIFKDEARDLLEWLAFHKMIGADLFFLYDNGSGDNGSELIRRSSFARNVTLTDWSDRPGQLSAYNHFHRNYAADFTWAAFIDIDEFIVPLAGSSIRDILLRRMYQPYAAILLQWLVFGPSGHDRRLAAWCSKTTHAACPKSADASRHIKSLVRPEQMLGMEHTPHAAECSGPVCNARGEEVLPFAIQPTECHDVMVCITTSPSRVRTGSSSAGVVVVIPCSHIRSTYSPTWWLRRMWMTRAPCALSPGCERSCAADTRQHGQDRRLCHLQGRGASPRVAGVSQDHRRRSVRADKWQHRWWCGAHPPFELWVMSR